MINQFLVFWLADTEQSRENKTFYYTYITILQLFYITKGVDFVFINTFLF